MPVIGTAIGLGVGGAAIGGLAGQYFAGQQASALAGANKLSAMASLAQALRPPPEIADITLQQYAIPEQYQLAGTLTPEQLRNTLLSDIAINAQQRQNQLDALNQYKQLSQTGLSAIDRAALTEIQNQIATQERGQREAILQNMAQRGLSGSGLELASRLQAGQTAAQTASAQSMEQAAQAQQARLQALANVAQMSQGLETTDYARAAQAAQAQDVINQFNVQNRNVAQSQNLAALQAIKNANVEQANKIAQANIDLANKQKWQNIVNKPLAQYGLQSEYQSGVANALQNQSALQAQQAMNQYQTQANLFGAGLQAGGTLGGAYAGRKSDTTQPQQQTTTRS
jgi:hypothetical protein